MFKKLLYFCLIAIASVECDETSCLDLHNSYRKLHGVQNLTIEEGLQKKADEAATAYLAAEAPKGFKAPDVPDAGVNFGFSKASVDDVLQTWYDEQANYDYKTPNPGEKNKHFTQLVWKDSAQLGCAVKEKKGTYFVVAYYNPKGNAGDYAANVVVPTGYGIGDCLRVHNSYRKFRRGGNLTKDEELTNAAFSKVTDYSGNVSVPTADAGIGLNYGVSETSFIDVLQTWYAESKLYSYKKPKVNDEKTKHFTQIVWKSSTKLGCAGLQIGGKYYVVALYKPEGNKGDISDYKKNVRPKSKSGNPDGDTSGAVETCSSFHFIVIALTACVSLIAMKE